MEQAINQVLQLFDAVVNSFGAVFGFLPSWDIYFVNGVIVFVIGIMLYKLIRG